MIDLVKMLADLQDLEEKTNKAFMEMNGSSRIDQINSIYKDKLKIQDRIIRLLYEAYKYDIKRYKYLNKKEEPTK